MGEKGQAAVQHSTLWLQEMPKHIEEVWVATVSCGGNQAEPHSKNTTRAPVKPSEQHLRGREAHTTVDRGRGGYVSGLSPTEHAGTVSTSSTYQPIPNLLHLPTHTQVSFCCWFPPFSNFHWTQPFPTSPC